MTRPALRRRRGTLAGIAALVCLAAAFTTLGVWQVERRAWKLDLIARVDARIHAAPVAAPGPAEWTDPADTQDYRRVAATGRFLAGEALVQAVTERGGGFWVLAPFATDAGFTVLVNRGFVPADARDPGTHPAAQGPLTVTGLVRLTEPGGGFLRANDPAAGRWYSRDVGAIADALGVDAAPYFIDAEAGANGAVDTLPVGGLTVVAFRNSHLVYALTWFALALMSLGGAVLLGRERSIRRDDTLAAPSR